MCVYLSKLLASRCWCHPSQVSRCWCHQCQVSLFDSIPATWALIDARQVARVVVDASRVARAVADAIWAVVSLFNCFRVVWAIVDASPVKSVNASQVKSVLDAILVDTILARLFKWQRAKKSERWKISASNNQQCSLLTLACLWREEISECQPSQVRRSHPRRCHPCLIF
jgi:hypothetical protein